jgi:hypothetical protein
MNVCLPLAIRMIADYTLPRITDAIFLFARYISLSTKSSSTYGRTSHLLPHFVRCYTYINQTAFLSPPWRNTLILLTASILIYPYLPSPSKQSLSPSLSPEAHASTSTSNSDTPLVTRLLAKYTPDAKITNERNDKHLELSAEKAGERLLFQEAERPRVHRMRFPR